MFYRLYNFARFCDMNNYNVTISLLQLKCMLYTIYIFIDDYNHD